MTSDLSPAAPGHPQARFDLRLAGHGESAIVRAAGDIDLTNVGQFQAVLDEAAAATAVTVDLTEVTYCDSSTIRALFLAARRVRLTIAVAAAGVVGPGLLSISGLDQVAVVVTPE